MSDRFEFGKNWSKFIAQNLSEDIVAQSGTALRRFLGLPTLKNLSFLDVGSGSGLSSLAAWRAGATNVISFDVDPLAVQTTQKLRSYAGNPENWQIMQGDVLDAAFMRALPEFDIVYSWGVLHHTGHMREAVRNAAYPCRKRGLLALALYSYTAYANGLASGLPGPEEWLEIKRHYLHARKLRRRLMELGYLWRCHCAPARGNPRGVAKGLADIWRCWREYDNSGRGMSFWTDIRDWLGGWPMEFVHEDELCRQVCDGGEFSLVRMNTGEGNTEFLFRRSGAEKDKIDAESPASLVWDNILSRRQSLPLQKPFSHVTGQMFCAPLPALAADGGISRLRLLEDGSWLSFANAPHAAIAAEGKGRYSSWYGTLYFSTSDNTDPNKNGREYTYFMDQDDAIKNL